MRISPSCWLTSVVLALPPPAAAQPSDQGLANLVSNLILLGITLPGGADPGTPHGGHFTLGNPTAGNSQGASVPDADTIRAVAAFGDRLRSQFAVVPLGSSTGGFTYSFDESSGIYTRNTDSFGPAFAERAATVGRRKLSIGFTYQHTGFDSFAGQSLREGEIKFYLSLIHI